MNWSDTPEQAAFRQQVRDFIEGNLPERYRRPEIDDSGIGLGNWAMDRRSDDPELLAACQQWVDALARQHWVASNWPVEFGGAGLTTLEQFILNEEFAIAGAPRIGATGAMFLGSVLMVHGTKEQQAKYMPPIVRGEINWEQGYSEPGAGSDLASVQLRAVRDGDEYVLNGQKIWSTPQTGDAMYALVRTDADAPKHRGISFLMIESLSLPGITWRPIMNMCGDYSSFGETFFDDARVPAGNIIGEENRGWYVAMTLMDFDRASISGVAGHRRKIQEVFDLTHDAEWAPRLHGGDTAVRAELADRMIEIEVGDNFARRLVSQQAAGLIPNYEASMAKVFTSEVGQRIARTGTKVLGLYSNLWVDEPRAPLEGRVADLYCRSVPWSIRGGTSEIQRNVIASRGLGLPRA